MDSRDALKNRILESRKALASANEGSAPAGRGPQN